MVEFLKAKGTSFVNKQVGVNNADDDRAFIGQIGPIKIYNDQIIQLSKPKQTVISQTIIKQLTQKRTIISN